MTHCQGKSSPVSRSGLCEELRVPGGDCLENTRAPSWTPSGSTARGRRRQEAAQSTRGSGSLTTSPSPRQVRKGWTTGFYMT